MYSPSTGFVNINILYTTLTVADRDGISVTRCQHITCGMLPIWIPSFSATDTLTDVFLVENVQQWLMCRQRATGHQGLHTDRHRRQHIVLTLHVFIYIIVIIFILIYISLHLYICLLSQNPVKFPERSLLFISSERFRNAFWQFL